MKKGTTKVHVSVADMFAKVEAGEISGAVITYGLQGRQHAIVVRNGQDRENPIKIFLPCDPSPDFYYSNYYVSKDFFINLEKCKGVKVTVVNGIEPLKS